MTDLVRPATLLISVDVEPKTNEADAVGRSLAAAERLLAMFERHQIPATWTLSEPATSVLRSRLTSVAKQEIALLGDASWVGRSAGRTRFARELSRRIGAARAARLPVTTLALRDVVLEDGLDLVVRSGISVVRGTTTGLSREIERRSSGPACRLLHFGVWELPATTALPVAGGAWRQAVSAWRLRRAIDALVQPERVLHVLIELFRVSRDSKGFFARLDRVLRHAARRQQQGALEVLTLSKMAAQLSQTNRSAPLRSILRTAA